ncbi:hypothetical protein E4H12_07585 [Candidatus Thorarchaeota archaeon]|nr:MAG: hypothetical protein E4H12_07585 [Candidatus Thorarchaeota archaeon]
MSPTNIEEPDLAFNGLIDGETIEWSQKAGIILRIPLIYGCIPMLLLILIPILLDAFVLASPASLLIVVAIYNVFAPPILLLLLLFVIYFLVRVNMTAYYITSQRLLEVRGKSIKKEIPRTNFQDLTVDQYLRSLSVQKHATIESFDLYITDNTSGVVIKMTGMDGKVAKLIEKWAKRRSA